MKRTVLICIVIIIMLIFVFAFAFPTNTKSNEEIKKTVKNVNEVIYKNENNEIQGKNIANEIENEKTNIDGNVAKNIVIDEVQNTSTETFEEEPKTDEEKAIEIVKKDWNLGYGEISMQGIDNNGNYIIQVTNSDTEVLAFYTVNVKDGTFNKREINY